MSYIDNTYVVVRVNLVVSFSGSLLFSLFLSSLIQEISEFLERCLLQSGFSPQVRSQITISLAKGIKSGLNSCKHISYSFSLYLDEVTKSLGGTSGLSENIFNTSILQDLLWSSSSDDTSTTRSRYKSDTD
jgi:hypothetical protein